MAFEPRNTIAQTMNLYGGRIPSTNVTGALSAGFETGRRRRETDMNRERLDIKKRLMSQNEAIRLTEKWGAKAAAISALPEQSRPAAWDSFRQGVIGASGKDPGPYSDENMQRILMESYSGQQKLEAEQEYQRQQVTDQSAATHQNRVFDENVRKTDEVIRHNQAMEANARMTGAGGNKPTSSNLKYQEMLSLGVPEPVAKGVAFGTFKTITDPQSGATMIIDLATSQPIGRMVVRDPDDKYNSPYVWQPAAPQPGTAPPQQGVAPQQMADPMATGTIDRDPLGLFK